jgi:hypothetical protein
MPASNALRPVYVEYGVERPLDEGALSATSADLSLPTGWRVLTGFANNMEVGLSTWSDATSAGLAAGELLQQTTNRPPLASRTSVPMVNWTATDGGNLVDVIATDLSDADARAWADWVLSLMPASGEATRRGKGYVEGSGSALDLGQRLLRMNFAAGGGGDDIARNVRSGQGMKGFFTAVA